MRFTALQYTLAVFTSLLQLGLTIATPMNGGHAVPALRSDTDVRPNRWATATTSFHGQSSGLAKAGPRVWTTSSIPTTMTISSTPASASQNTGKITLSGSYSATGTSTTTFLASSSTASVPEHIYVTSTMGGQAYVMRTMGDDGQYGSTTYAMRMSDATATAMWLATSTTSVAGHIYVTSLPSATAYIMRTMGSDSVYGSKNHAMDVHGTVTIDELINDLQRCQGRKAKESAMLPCAVLSEALCGISDKRFGWLVGALTSNSD